MGLGGGGAGGEGGVQGKSAKNDETPPTARQPCLLKRAHTHWEHQGYGREDKTVS